MKPRYIFAAALVLLAAAASLPDASSQIPDPHNPVKVSVPAVRVPRGGTVTAVATVTIDKGYRIQANPTTGKYLQPTMLVFQGIPGVHAEEPVYPKGKDFHLEGDPTMFPGYEGSIEIKVPIKASPKADLGDHILNGILRFHPSTTEGFKNERTLPVQLSVKVVKK